MDRAKALEKIKKCLALSRSSNEHEAAAALRQAQAMMRDHGIEESEALGVNERYATAMNARTPMEWEARLANRIAATFGCELIFSSAGMFRKQGRWLFIGCDHHPDIATYAFEVLLRQVKRARAQYMSEKLKRYGKQNKTRMADMFCLGWIRTATSQLDAFTHSDAQRRAIDAFLGKLHPDLRSFTPRNRADEAKAPARVDDAYRDGMVAGKDAQLNRGVNGATDSPKRLERR